jgi:hypothetical protein
MKFSGYVSTGSKIVSKSSKRWFVASAFSASSSSFASSVF